MRFSSLVRNQKQTRKKCPRKDNQRKKSERTQERRLGVKGHKGVLNECIYLRIGPFSFIHNDSYCIQFIDNKCLRCFSLNFDIIFHLHCVLGAVTTELNEHKVLCTLSFLFLSILYAVFNSNSNFLSSLKDFCGLKIKTMEGFYFVCILL